MLTPARALSLAADADALPRVDELDGLYRFGFVPRRGQLLMVAGQPGAGKSAFALWFAQRMNARTLYFSADMDAHTAVTRLAALITGFTVDEVASGLNGPGFGYYEQELQHTSIQFCFDSGPTLQDVADEIAAYVELWDAYPEVIVIDNAMNVEAEMGEEHAGLRLIFKELHRLARETGAGVVVLHHTREEASPFIPQQRASIQGKVAQLPERILTVALDTSQGAFLFAPVKNRGGKQDATGGTYFRLTAVPERATFRPYVPITY
jgi:predicted ATP-dependent serine protease